MYNKLNSYTISISNYFHAILFCRKQLGGKLGTSLQTDLGVNTVGDMLHFSEEKLQEHYGINTGYNISLVDTICGLFRSVRMFTCFKASDWSDP